jgi:hypothetical protein
VEQVSETEVRPDDYGAAAFMLRVLHDSGKGLTPEQVEDLIPVLQSAARLQRVVDDLADGLRSASARLIEISRMAYDAGQQEIYNHAYYGGVLKTLERYGLLRPCDDPAQVPEAMRAEVE